MCINVACCADVTVTKPLLNFLQAHAIGIEQTGAGRGNGYASSGVLPENPGNAGSESRAESAFPSGLHIIPTKAMSARLPITLLTGIPSRILPW